AREVAVSSLATVYALSATSEQAAQQLAPIIAAQWSLATAFALLAWYVFAPQCLSTLAVMRRETNSWRTPLIAAAYLVRSFAPSLWSRGMDAMCAVLPKSMRPERRSRGQTAAPRGGCASCNDCGGCGPRK